MKNNNETLPFERKVRNIALFGCTSYDFIAGGTGSGNVNRAYTVSLLDGLKNAGYQIDEALKADYEQYIEAENKKILLTRLSLSPDLCRYLARQNLSLLQRCCQNKLLKRMLHWLRWDVLPVNL